MRFQYNRSLGTTRRAGGLVLILGVVHLAGFLISNGSAQVTADITGEIEIVAMPSSLLGGSFVSSNQIRLMHEGAGIVTAGMPGFQADGAYHNPALGIGQPADATFANAIVTPYAGPGLPAVGTQVYSILLHFDPNLSGLPLNLAQGIARTGTITFNRRILGVYVTSGALNSTDAIFGSGTVYPTSIGRDMEFNYDGDSFSVDSGRYELSVTMFVHNGGVFDEMRIILETNTPPVAVPDVTGLAQAMAETNILAANLTVGSISNASSATVAADIVLDQNPSAGTNVPPGTAIDLLVSTGPIVPDVLNLTQAAATNAIIVAGLSVGSISNAPHGIVPSGSVSSQNPAAGTSATIGSPVNLIVSSGATVPLVSAPAYQDGVFQLSVPTLTGRVYILEFTDEVTGTNWVEAQSLSGNDTMQTLMDSSATNHQRYYRVRME